MVSSPRQVQGKPPKITDTWQGPYVIRKRLAEVLYVIAPYEYDGPELVVHASRLMPYITEDGITKSRIPRRLITNDLGDELAEEIRFSGEATRHELGVSVQLAVEKTQILDFDKTQIKNKPTDADTTDTVSGDVLPMTFTQVQDEIELDPESMHVEVPPSNEINNEPSTSKQV